jgi:hypothetical protein
MSHSFLGTESISTLYIHEFRLCGPLKPRGKATACLMSGICLQDPASDIHIGLLIMCVYSSEEALVWVLDDQAAFQQLLLVAFLVV